MQKQTIHQSIIPTLERTNHSSAEVTFGSLSMGKALKCLNEDVNEGIGEDLMVDVSQSSCSDKLDIATFCGDLEIPSQSGKTDFHLHLNVGEDLIEISYKTGPGQFTPSPLKLSRFIPLNASTFQVFGLIQAECTKGVTYPSFEFTNNVPELVLFVLDYFEKIWKISRENWKVYVEYSRKAIDNNEEKRIVDYWAHRLSINRQKIKVRMGSEERLSERAALYGTVSIRLNNRIAQTLIMHFLEKIKGIVESDEKAAGSYVCGLFAGDGIVLEHKGQFSCFGLSFNPHSSELDHYVKVLRRIGVYVDEEEISRKGKRAIFFNHWHDCYVFLEVTDGKLFLPHRENALKFCKGFLSNQYVKPLLRLRLFRAGPLKAKDFAEKVDISKRSANGSLSRYVKLGFLTKNGKGTRASPFQFSLTKEGKRFLELVEMIESFLKRDVR